MPRQRSYLETTVDDFRSLDIAWLKRRGGLDRDYGEITWSRRGETTGKIRYLS